MCKSNNRIMLIDDDYVTIEIVRTVIDDLGYQYFPFSDIEAAKESFKKIKPTLVITDLYMPDINGHMKPLGEKMAKWIKSSDELCPVMILSSETSIIKHIEYMINGISTFQTKPIDKKQLEAKIIRLSNISRLRSLNKKDSSREYGVIKNA